jgi:hypothetical protein
MKMYWKRTPAIVNTNRRSQVFRAKGTKGFSPGGESINQGDYLVSLDEVHKRKLWINFTLVFI